jgi:hypothetical protein
MKGKMLLSLREIFTFNLILFTRGFVFLTGVNTGSFDARQGVEPRNGVYSQVEHDLNSWVREKRELCLSKGRRAKQRGRKRKMIAEKNEWEEDNGVPKVKNT